MPAALRTTAGQRLVSLTLGFGKVAPEPPAVADLALIVTGLPGLVFITQGPAAHVKHPCMSCTQLALGRRSRESSRRWQCAFYRSMISVLTAPLLAGEQPGDMPLYLRCDHHHPRLCRRLCLGNDARQVPEMRG
jgi:hypothetical protein